MFYLCTVNVWTNPESGCMDKDTAIVLLCMTMSVLFDHLLSNNQFDFPSKRAFICSSSTAGYVYASIFATAAISG